MSNITLTVRPLQNRASFDIDRANVSVPVDEKTTMAKVKEFVSKKIGVPSNNITLIVNEPIDKICHKQSCCKYSTVVVPLDSRDLRYLDDELVLEAMKSYCGDMCPIREGFSVYNYGPRQLYYSIHK